MAGRIWIGPYKSLGVSTQAVPGGGYLNIDASAGNFGPSPLAQLGLQVAQGAAGIATVFSEHLAGDNEATVKLADTRVGETEQALLFDPQNGYLNLRGQDAVTQAPAVLDAYTKAQDRERATLTDDDQRRMFGELADRRLATFSTQVERHAAAERQRWYDTASDRRIALMQADAGLHWNDDALLRRSLGTARAEVRDQAERKGWDSALTETVLRQQTSRTLITAISTAVDRDPKRAQALRTRYEAVIEDHDRAALNALLAEAEIRERAAAASTEILNAAPPVGEQSTTHWRLRQTEAITDLSVRAATIRCLDSAAAADETRARALGEEVLVRVLKDGLTDPSQIPVREWVALDAERRQAIEARLDHNAAGTEPVPKPALVDMLATQMTQAPYDFARRDLVPAIALLPLPQWQRFRDWQTGLKRKDIATQDEIYAIRRGLQLAGKMLRWDVPGDIASNDRADLVDEIDTWRRVNGKSPDDDDIANILQRSLTPLRFVPPLIDDGDRGEQGIILIQGGGSRQTRGSGSGPGSRSTVEQRQFDMYRPALERVQRFNPEYYEIYPRDYVPTRGDILRLNELGTAYARIHEFFQAHGISLAPRAYEEIRQQELRGVSLPSIVNTYRRGDTFFNLTNQPTPNRYIRREPDGIFVGVSKPEGGRIESVFPGEIVPGWQVVGRGSATPRRDDRPLPDLAPPNILPPRSSRGVAPGTDLHHPFVQQSWNPERKAPLKFSQAAQDVFDSKTIRVMKGDHWNWIHRIYNERILIALNEYLSRPDVKARGITPETMTTAQAEELYEAIVTRNPDPIVQGHLNRMLESWYLVRSLYPHVGD